MLQKAKKKVQADLSRKDLPVIQAVRTLDDIDSAKSLLFERLNEWFKLNFPDLEIQNEETYCKVVAEFGAREEFDLLKLQEMVGVKRAIHLMEKAEASYGASFDLQDRKAVKALARRVLGLYETRTELETYISFEAERLMKNIAYLTDPLFSARLLATAGSLQRLAKMPGSTIQVIGAEKALFRHLRKGSRPPKHGVLFQTALISTAPPDKRGTFARILASKIAIAAKADYYSKNFIAPQLKEKMDERIKEARSHRSKPKPTYRSQRF